MRNGDRTRLCDQPLLVRSLACARDDKRMAETPDWRVVSPALDFQVAGSTVLESPGSVPLPTFSDR